MKEHPLLLSGDMVLAMLAGRKTQTRRLPSSANCLIDGCQSRTLFKQLDWDNSEIRLDNGPSPAGNSGPYLHVPNKDGERWHRVYPKYQVGDTIWFKETFCAEGAFGIYGRIQYRADYPNGKNPSCLNWKPSIFMPKEAARLKRRLANLRIERLHQISEDDAVAEGCQGDRWQRHPVLGPCTDDGQLPTEEYRELWNRINGPNSWDLNPFVFVLELKPL